MSQTKKNIAKIPYEEALEELEGIVESMESGDIPLEDLVKRYEEGFKLLQHCKKRLEDVDLKIQQLKDNKTEAFDAN